MITEKVDTLATLPLLNLAQPLAGFSMSKTFYVYVHKYASGPKIGKVFYIGKGSENRFEYSGSGRNRHWHNIVNKYNFIPEIVMYFDNELCSFSFEKALISFYGRSHLCNFTDGGEGVCGLKHTEETKIKMSGPRPHANNWLKDKPMPTYLKEKLRLAKLGKKQSKEHAQKSRVAKLGKVIEDTSKFNIDKRKAIQSSDGEIFVSAAEAARCLSKNLGTNASQGNISMACSGKRKSAYGRKWRYLNDPTN